jgi:hypothetical protein
MAMNFRAQHVFISHAINYKHFRQASALSIHTTSCSWDIWLQMMKLGVPYPQGTGRRLLMQQSIF